MSHGSLFSGIGGFDIAAQWMGWNNIFHCEWNEFGQKVLKHYWPNAISYGDITKTDFTIHGGTIDVLTGGFPCQPYSTAGKRKGKEDDRHLWPEMLRAIREIQPGWVVGENVHGLINWNRGMVFDEVQTDLETEGYEVWPYVLPACAVNAPHRRDRVWFVANSKKSGIDRINGNGRIKKIENGQWTTQSNRVSDCWITPYTQGSGMEGNRANRQQKSQTQIGSGLSGCNSSRTDWSEWPTQQPIRRRNDGLPSGLSGITFSKHRKESIKAYGNAIVPQVAFEIFKVIKQMNFA